MTVERAIALFDVREKQALAFCEIYKDKLAYEDLQRAIDDYCNNMAKSFVENHSQAFTDETFRTQLKRHLHNVGADKPHSGKRFHEAIYKQVVGIKTETADKPASADLGRSL